MQDSHLLLVPFLSGKARFFALSSSVKYGNRTRVPSLRGWCPGRLDEPDIRGFRAVSMLGGTRRGDPLVEQVGIEPTTSCLQNRRSSI